jgi:uncharacterized RDD family membrane protein YckC
MTKQEPMFAAIPPPLPESIVLHTIALKGQRFSGHLLDFIFAYLFALPFGYILGIILALFHSAELLHQINHIVLSSVILFLYYFTQEALFGKTVGKRIIGTQALNVDGSTLTVKRAFYRTLCRFIPFDALSFLIDGDSPRGWHDTLSKTVVISVKDDRKSC